jgi:putative transposase
MKKFDPEIHHRRSIRLNNFDYSQPACYFISITTKGRKNLFGQIINGKMILNDAGKLIDEQWRNLTGRFTHIKLDEYIVMPNHLHGIINIVGATVGADQCVCPDNKLGEHMGSPLRSDRTCGERGVEPLNGAL